MSKMSETTDTKTQFNGGVWPLIRRITGQGSADPAV